MMATHAKTDFETFHRSYLLARDLAQASIDLMEQISPSLYCGPPLSSELEEFRRNVQRAYEAAFMPDNVRPPRPSLRLVTGD